jgi:hypothetical protein
MSQYSKPHFWCQLVSKNHLAGALGTEAGDPGDRWHSIMK